jgi:uncharacterized membrane protein YgcG
MHSGTVLHASAPVDSPALALVLVLAGLGASGVLGLALAAFVRRRSRSYLLVVLAVATLLGRSLVAGASLQGLVPPGDHHVLEHGLDVAMVALVVAAVYTARTAPPAAGGGEGGEGGGGGGGSGGGTGP